MPNIKNRSLLDLIKYPIITDKTTKLLEEKQYSFAVDRTANKNQIKQAIEYIFNVNIKKVNTCNTPKKKKRVGKFIGKKTNYKKAIITLKEGCSIPIFPDQ
uniref:Large ribosomal subunit protein uL23c n=1 Tax=Riquetophycus sp. TaxID=1897556 RepID=A0A1C9C8I1_9FLOR|nr:ribosomal protein L23 [Riquetophycus sp.]